MPIPKSASQVLALEISMEGWKSAIATASQLDSVLDGIDDASVKINVDDAEIASALTSLTQLEDDATVKVDVNDTEITSALLLYDDLAEDQSVTVNVNDQEVEATLAALQQLRNLAIVDIVLNLPSDVNALIESIPGLSTLVDIQSGGRIFAASTGIELPTLSGGLDPASTLFGAGFGESIEDNARLIATISNIMGETDPEVLMAIARNAHEAAVAIEGITGQQQDANDLFVAQKKLIEGGVVGSFSEASDFMVSGFQSIIGYSGDFLGDLGEFAPLFGALGFTAQQTLSTLSTGLGAGVDNISRFAEILPSFAEQANSANDAFTDSIDTLGDATGVDLGAQLDAFEQGKLSGADFISGILDAARSYTPKGSDPTLQTLLPGIFGSTVSNIGADTLLKINPNADEFTDIKGAAADAAAEIRDTIGAAVTELVRTMETELATALDETFDLSDRIDTAKGQFQTFIDELKGGEGFGKALEIAFEFDGVDEFIGNFERIVGNLEIVFLQVVASIQDITGHGDQASATREIIAAKSTAQLPFDLKLANAEEIAAVVNNAVANGVNPDAVAALAGTAVTELINSGEFDKAQTLLDSVAQLPADLVNNAGVLGIDSAMLNERMGAAGLQTQLFDPTDLQKQIDDAKAQVDLVFGPTAPALIDPLANMPDILKNDASNPFNNLKEIFKTNTDAATLAQTDITAAGEATALAVTTATEAVIASTEGAALAVQLMDTDIAAAMMGNTVTASFEAVEDSAVATMAGVEDAVRGVFPTVLQLDALLRSVAAATATVQQSVNTAVAGAGAGGGSTTNNVYNVNQNNNVQSAAQATNAGYALGAAIRPGGG